MTTIYQHQYCNIPFMSGSYASGNIVGPITHKNPISMPQHNLGVLFGKYPTPVAFYPSNMTNDYSVARNLYQRTYSHLNNVLPNNSSTSVYIPSLQKSVRILQHSTYIAPKTSYDYMTKLKSIHIGKSSYKQGLPYEAPLSYKGRDANESKRMLRRVRSGGTVAPRKKSYF